MSGYKFEFQTCSLWGMSQDECFKGLIIVKVFLSASSLWVLLYDTNSTEQCSVSSIYFADDLGSYLQPVYNNYENYEY